MRQRLEIAVLGLILLIIAMPASAQFYQYVDAKGITHFTDNISTIPPQYQSQVRQHQKRLPPQKENFHLSTDPYGTADDVLPAPESLKSATPSEIAKLAEERKVLLDKKQVLDTKFERLMAEKRALKKSSDDMKDHDAIKRYNTRVREINKKIKQYKKEEKYFKSEIDRYNDLIEPLIAE